jgi:methylenetetrahydrofolate dehydrogenase (NADP+)/methenyltetrahydrofolate cyclohydrolase
MHLLDGKLISEQIKAELTIEVEQIKMQGGKIPHLAAIIVGENPASQVYVASKIRSCEQVGFKSSLVRCEADISQEELLKIVEGLNNDPDVDGFIVQLPLPKHIDEEAVTLAIAPQKDVDGFHPVNFGRMAQGLPSFLPATPMGILEILKRYNIETSGKHCVVIGRSNIVGTPISILLSRKGYPGDCTVTLTHSRTQDLPAEVRRADIVVAAIGIPEFVKADWVKEGAVVIDVGINRIPDDSKKSGTRIAETLILKALRPGAVSSPQSPAGLD